MYPFSISTDAHVPLKFPMTIHFIMIIHRYIKQQAYNDFLKEYSLTCVNILK